LLDNPPKRRGIVSSSVIKCCKCDHTADINTSDITRSRLYDNIRFVYGLRLIGKGRDAGKVLNAVLNIPEHLTSFNIYNKPIGSAVAEVSESSIMEAGRQDVSENEEDVPSLITACVDGNWQKCGHTSLNDII
jgi:hypothetical protein